MMARPSRPELLLLAFVAIVFLPFAWAEFFWDDRLVFRVGGQVESLRTLLQIPFRRCMLFPDHIEYDYYRPLIDSLFVLEFAIAGRTPFLYHFTNYALHLGNLLLAFALLRRVIPGGGLAVGAGLGVFALHPIQSESVMWIAARPGVISLFLGLLMMHALVRCVEAERGSRAAAWGVAACACYVLALLGKEVAIALLPGLLPLWLVVPRQRRSRAVAAWGALLAITVVYLALNRAPGGNLRATIEALGPGGYILAIFRFYGFYIATLAWPFGLIPTYPLWIDQRAGMLPLGIAGAVATFGAIAWAFARRTPAGAVAGTALLYMGGSLILPTVGGQFQVADRYAYQSMLGLGIALAVFLSWLLEARPALRDSLPRVVALALLLLGSVCLVQNLIWTRERTMWNHTLRIDPQNIPANFLLSDYALAEKDDAAAAEFLRAGLEAGRPYPAREVAYRALLLGEVLARLGETADALGALQVAKEHEHFRARAIVLEAIIHNEAGDPARAARLLNTIPREGEPWSVYLSAASILRAQGNAAAAREWYAIARRNGAPEQPGYE